MLDRAPKLFPDLIWIWNAFLLMSRSRGSGFGGPEPINVLRAVYDYCLLMEIDNEDDKEDLLVLITALDDCWLDHQYKERDKRKTAESKKPVPNTPFRARKR